MMGTLYSIATPSCLPPACRLPAGRQGRQGRQVRAWWAGKKRKRALAQNNDYTKWHEEHDDSVSVREYSEQAMTFAAARENRYFGQNIFTPFGENRYD